MSSAGDGLGWRLAKARRRIANASRWLGVGDQFRELARGIVIPGGERDGGLDEGACDAFAGFRRSGGQDEGELVEVRGFDEIEACSVATVVSVTIWYSSSTGILSARYKMARCCRQASSSL